MREHPALDPLDAALQHSRYLQRLNTATPDLITHEAAEVMHPYDKGSMNAFVAAQGEIVDDGMLKRVLRTLRKRVMARLIMRDISRLATLDEVVKTVTSLAEIGVEQAACHHARWLQPQFGEPIGDETGTAQQLIVIGMGKLGGSELNVSSDIDLIFAYPEDGHTNGPRKLSNHEFFTRLGRLIIATLHEPTADGFVFRVDMRLRPYGDSGPLASSFAMLEEYLHTQGREWERYAWLKGRALTGDADGLWTLVKPFVYRKYLDYGAYASMRSLHGQIRREVARRDMADNIKLGPGGIREIEFIAQVFQLIRGGRERGLQMRSTRKVLSWLGEHRLIPPHATRELQEAYAFLRNLEHRLQYLDDAQTQTLPSQPDDRRQIASSMGYSDVESFEKALQWHRSRVTNHFEHVFTAPQQEGEHPLDDLWQDDEYSEQHTAKLAELGYQEPDTIKQLLSQMKSSTRYRQMPESSRRRLDALLPPMIEVAAGMPNPDGTLTRLIRLLDAILRRESYLALLSEHPQTLKRLANLYSASPWVSDYLTRHPILLDELLDARLLYAAPDWAQTRARLAAELDAATGDAEQQMDLLRHCQHTQLFRLVAQDLAGLLPLETLSDHLSDLADMILAEVVRCCWQALPGKHRDNPLFAIIGYGKLGGKELGYASDLDLIFLYEDDHDNAGENYAKLARRIGTWLSTATPAGTLYEIDLRLRPNGESGLMVTTIEGFAAYQHQHAWVWEHQALTRARFCAGEPSIGAQFEQIRQQVLMKQRDLNQLRQEVYAMRHKMLENRLGSREGFDLKHGRGGIIDVEFIVQYLVLAHAAHHPKLTGNKGNLALLGFAAEAGLLSAADAQAAQQAYREYRRLQHAQRLDGRKRYIVDEIAITPHIQTVMTIWRQVFGQD
ncbi:glutamate-ammonia-ligase adenylyltransferase [Chitinivorax tropicus]|uniref:Bifunctional glutamine synthetase adenylyltransferase/adenylyl-removing enzyme n=1 Tax=Chitinivorax tropicus TaxID=714531 RepID=A0A840MNL2_9PROT|nr:bifunctional [glutamate--ammonia ligase]-adenylyl-L-tyrosine phosphorylase/[glutamate--ammonia-ligase] adenylyltransferase [Chitinivorax tropicus]MBB5018679.1 glutamate-ammonia-ligase adenylyltransferase [Chitinivorax tropicus]